MSIFFGLLHVGIPIRGNTWQLNQFIVMQAPAIISFQIENGKFVKIKQQMYHIVRSI